MNYTLAGFNLSGLSNMSQLNITQDWSLSGVLTSVFSIFSEPEGIIINAIIYVAMLLMFFWALSEVSPFATFRYTYPRAFLLAICLVNLISITMIEIGYTQSFRLVSILIIINIIATFVVLIGENPQ